MAYSEVTQQKCFMISKVLVMLISLVIRLILHFCYESNVIKARIFMENYFHLRS